MAVGGSRRRPAVRRADRARALRPGAGVARRRATPGRRMRASCATGMGSVDPVVREALADAARAVREDDQPGLAAARGTVRAALFRGAFATTLDATDAWRRADRTRVAAAARVPHGDALHPPRRERDAGARPARARQDRARPPRGRRSPRTCSTPTRRACATCSPTPAAGSSRTSPCAARRRPRRPPATSRSSPTATARTEARPPSARRRRRSRRSPAPATGLPRRWIAPTAHSRASPRRRSRPRRRHGARSSCCSSSPWCPSSTGAA